MAEHDSQVKNLHPPARNSVWYDRNAICSVTLVACWIAARTESRGDVPLDVPLEVVLSAKFTKLAVVVAFVALPVPVPVPEPEPESDPRVWNSVSGPKPTWGTNGVGGVVIVQLNVVVNLTVAFAFLLGLMIRISGAGAGSDALAELELVTSNWALSTESKRRYWTVVPLTQCRTSST